MAILYVCSPLTLSLYAQQIPTSVAFLDAFFELQAFLFSCYASSFLRQLMLNQADFSSGKNSQQPHDCFCFCAE